MIFIIKGRIPSKKNSKRWIVRGNRKFMVPSENHEVWHEDAMWQLKAQKWPLHPISKAQVHIIFIAPDKRSSDLTNKAESIMDLLVDAGILEDDNWFVVGAIYLSFGGISKEGARAEIDITDLSTSTKE